MKTQLLILIAALAITIAPFGGCDNNEEDLFISDTFDGTENEKIVFELDNVPAYVTNERAGYVSIYYSKYADDFFENNNYAIEIEKDIQNHRIGVELADFNTYGIPYHSKVYVSASVTNRGRLLDEDGMDWFWGGLPTQRKAYLKNLKPRY